MKTNNPSPRRHNLTCWLCCNIVIICSLCCGVAAALTSCDNEDEVVPLTDQNVGTKYYKIPDPVLLTEEEQTEVQAIRSEYRNAIN